ncbi:DUF726 domain-containing protein [Halomonas cupida]|uniref:DUF726 domain-containing protein n=1 Tax=Halomonas cupida TaxID=44933 RepID=UPI003EF51A15
MIYSVLQERELSERKAIIKLLGLMLFSSPPMNKKELTLIETLCEFSGFNEQDVAAAMRLDMRENWLFDEVIDETLSVGSQKLLLFLAKLCEFGLHQKSGLSLFSGENEYSSFISKNFEPNIHFGVKAQENICTLANSLCKSSCEIYDIIYSEDLDKKELEEIPASEKIFMLNSIKLYELSTLEASNFVLIFNNKIMKNHEGSASGAETMFLNYILGAFYQNSGASQDYIEDGSGSSHLNIEKPWLKNLLMLASLSRLEENEDPFDDIDINKMADDLDIDNKLLSRTIHPAIMNYKATCIECFERLHDVSRDDYAPGVKGTDYLRRALFVADIATDFVPGVAGFKKVHKLGKSASSFVDDFTADEERAAEKIFGLRRVSQIDDTKFLHICIDGFMSESAKGQFSDWRTSLETRETFGSIFGFSWPSRNFDESGITCWYEAVENSYIYGNELAKQIINAKTFAPDLKVRLYGHSLGGRVIHNALVALLGSGCKVDQAYLFGGAVSRKDKQRWAGALQSVEDRVFNFYSMNDDVLKKLYHTAELGDDPVGLGEIEYFKTKGVGICEVVNIDVTEIVGGHTEYKSNLVSILEHSSL